MDELPDDPDKLTPEMVYNAPAGEKTDLLCLSAQDIPARKYGYDQPKMSGRDSQIRPHYRVSRNASAAYRAREYLRNHAPDYYEHLRIIGGLRRRNEITEHLATARWFLDLYAEGMSEADDE